MPNQENALARLVKSRVDGTVENYSTIAVRGNMPRSTVHKLATGPITALPKRETLEKLAIGLGLPASVVIRAAQEAAGYFLYDEELPDGETTILINSISQLTPDQRASVSSLVDHLLRTSE